MKTWQIIISGRVQGVGFRYFTVNKALANRIRGTVENTRDRKVEIFCQGALENIDNFLLAIKKGPSLSRVDLVVINKIDRDEYSGFRVI